MSAKAKETNKKIALLSNFLKKSQTESWYSRKNKISYLAPAFRKKELEKSFEQELRHRLWEYEFLSQKLKRLPQSTVKQAIFLWLNLRRHTKPPTFEHLTNFPKTNVLAVLAGGVKKSLKEKKPKIELHSVFCPHYTYVAKSPLYQKVNQKKAKNAAKAINDILKAGKGLISKYAIHTVSEKDFDKAPFLRCCLHPTLSTNKKAMKLNKELFDKQYLPILSKSSQSSIPIISDDDLLYVEPYAKLLIKNAHKIWGKNNVKKCKKIITTRFYKEEFQEKYGVSPNVYSRNFYLYPATCQYYRAISEDPNSSVKIFLGLERLISWYYGKGHNIDFTKTTPRGNLALLCFVKSLRQPWAIEN